MIGIFTFGGNKVGWVDQGRQKHGYFGHGIADIGHQQQLRGQASYYNLPGNNMANGKPYDGNALNAAMLHVPLGTKVRVTSLRDPSKSIEVTVTDRGPYVSRRIIDLTPKAFEALFGSTRSGVGPVIVQVPGR
jgi:rare lipoprotein A